MIRFELDEPTPLLNVVLRMHWSKRRKLAARFAWLIRAATSGQRPEKPYGRAKVRIERHSTRTPDYDGMVGGAKQVIDCLLPLSVRHPHGLGLVADDSPSCLELEVVAVKAADRRAQKTVIVIEEVA